MAVTPEEIRETVFREVLNRVQDYGCTHTGKWDEVRDACPGCYRLATEIVNGLAWTGLLPTELPATIPIVY